MIAAKQNFERYKGDSYPIKLTLLQAEDTPLVITGSTITLKVQNALGTEIEKTITGTITDAVQGKAQFNFETTTFIEVGSFKYEVEMLTSTGVMYTIATGVLKIVQDLG